MYDRDKVLEEILYADFKEIREDICIKRLKAETNLFPYKEKALYDHCKKCDGYKYSCAHYVPLE